MEDLSGRGGEVHGEGSEGDGGEEEGPHLGGEGKHVHRQSVCGGALRAPQNDA